MIIDHIKKEDNKKILRKVIQDFIPISIENISSEDENPDFFKFRNIKLNDILNYLQNKLTEQLSRSTQIAFPFMNFRLNDSFISFQRENLFRKLFSEIYAKYKFIRNLIMYL